MKRMILLILIFVLVACEPEPIILLEGDTTTTGSNCSTPGSCSSIPYIGYDNIGDVQITELNLTSSKQQMRWAADQISSGMIEFDASAGSETDILLTFPHETTDIAGLHLIQTFSALQTFTDGLRVLDNDRIQLGNVNQGNSDAAIEFDSATTKVLFYRQGGAGNDVLGWRFEDADVEVEENLKVEKEVNGSLVYCIGGGYNQAIAADTYLKHFNGADFGADIGVVQPSDGSLVKLSTSGATTGGASGWNFTIRKNGVYLASVAVNTGIDWQELIKYSRDAKTFSEGDVLSVYADETSGAASLTDIVVSGWCYYDS